MEGHFNYRNYMAYPKKLNSKISIDLCQLRDSTVNANRVFMLSRYVNQCKNKNTAFPFTQKPYEYVINPENLSITINLLQFVQSSSFFLSYLQENPDIFATVTMSIRKQWQYVYMINCIIPSFFGFFSCHEYAEYAIGFYTEIFKKTNPAASIQIIRPFFHSCITYHFFQNAYSPFIQSVMVDENIIKNPDKQVSVYANLFIDYITNSIQFLPNEFFKLLKIIQTKNWDFKHKKSLIVDNFLFPELKIWASRFSLNNELKSFILRIIDMITISCNVSHNNFDFNENGFSSLSSSPNLFKPMRYLTDSSSSFNLSALALEPEVPAPSQMPISRSTSIIKSPKAKLTGPKISNESKTTIILMTNFINSLFSENTICSIYQMPVLYENFSDEIFAQCTQFTLCIYDVRFISKLLERCHLFPNKITSAVFLADSIENYNSGVFYSHVYSHHINAHNITPYMPLFKTEKVIKKEKAKQKKSSKLNLALVENDLFIKFLKINKHYAAIYNSFLIETGQSLISEQTDSIEKYIIFSTLMNEINIEKNRIFFSSSFEIESYADMIVNAIKNDPNSYKKKPFIKLFIEASKVFNTYHLFQAKKMLYLKLLDMLYKDMIGDYWRVLVDFGKYWEEIVNEPKEKQNLVTLFSTMNPNFQISFIDSTKLLSQIDNKTLLTKFYIMTYAFELLSHIAQNVSNSNEIFKVAFQHVKAKELLTTFLIIDSMAIKVDVFQEFCTKAEIESWNYMKKNIETYINRNEQYKTVFMSINEYLIAITPSLLYNPSC